MIDDHHEELAALYAFDLLEGVELTAFEASRRADPALRRLVDELRAASTTLAHTAPEQTPPPALKARLMAHIGQSSTSDKVIPFRGAPLLAWSAAASFAISALWLGQLYTTARTENSLLIQQQALAEVSVQSAKNQLEADRILLEHQLQDAEVRLANLNQELKEQNDLARFKITTLSSMLGNSPEATAVAIWNPQKQEGVISVAKLPALAANEDYQLWVVDPQYSVPVDGGVFRVDPDSGEAKFKFKTAKPIDQVAAFAVSLERKGGVPQAEGPMVLLGK